MVSTAIAATGDSMITRRLSAIPDPAFLAVRDLLSRADGRFTNFEMTCPGEPATPSSKRGGLHLSADPFVLDELRWLGMNLYGVANNHALDYSTGGLLETLSQLRARELVHAGAGATLGRARAVGYLDTRGGRIGLVAAASSSAEVAAAADPRPDMQGRPGINPLRHETIYTLDRERHEALAEIDRALGTGEAHRLKAELGIYPDFQHEAEEVLTFLGRRFVRGDAPNVTSAVIEPDLEGTLRAIRDARRQADVVLASIHAHEGPNGQWNSAWPADFVVDAVHAMVDAGADMVIGHGPHMLRPVELYRGRPIFYSLGNFIFMYESVQRLPEGSYQEEGLPPTATPADLFDSRSGVGQERRKGFVADQRYWDSVVPLGHMEDGRWSSIRLHPVHLGHGEPRSRHGVPRFPEGETAERILSGLAESSQSFGTSVAIERIDGDLVGVLKTE